MSEWSTPAKAGSIAEAKSKLWSREDEGEPVLPTPSGKAVVEAGAYPCGTEYECGGGPVEEGTEWEAAAELVEG